MHGMQDPAAPYKGGGKFKLSSHQDSLKYLVNWYEIKGKKKQIKGDKTYKSLSANDFIMRFFKKYEGLAPYLGDIQKPIVTSKKS